MIRTSRLPWLILAVSVLAIAACDNSRSKSTKKETDPLLADVSSPEKPGGSDPDKLDTDPDLPKSKGGSDPDKPDPKKGTVFIDPGLATPDIKKPKVNFDLPKLSPTVPNTETGPVEVSVPALAKPEAGMAKPDLKPRILALTLVGGPGNQWIQKVGWDKAGQIYAESGGGDFTVYYNTDGSRFLGVKGDVKKESSGPRGQPMDTKGKPFIATDPTSEIQLEVGTTTGLTLPYLNSSAKWKWWDRGKADLKGIDAKARGVRVYFLHEGRFMVKANADAGNSLLARDPQDIKKENTFGVNVPKGAAPGPFTYYAVGSIKTGEPLLSNFIRGRVLAEAIDPWERLYLGVAEKDTFTKGGVAGFTVIDANLTTVLFNGTVGADAIYSMALRDDMLLLGGVIGRVPEDAADAKINKAGLPPEKLRMVNPAQADPGGGEDGFFAIIKLW